ncbi:MAG TPA: GNAT family N-acetyltransferase [Bryobacteraceae bacterium]|nr:GNAT family N-acetyltransferase [Bryobacteraceae bacterium]
MRLLTADDIPAACALSDAAGWNQTPDDWRRMIEIEPLGCFGIVQDDQLVATSTLLTYGREVAWIGMVLTHADYQRRGYARRLVTAALELACVREIRCVKLDATRQGAPLYSSLGFEDEQPISRWRREAAPIPSAEPVPTGMIPRGEDRNAFGVDRWKYLATLGEAAVIGNAYACHRPGSKAHYFGPCVARDTASVHRLVSATLACDPEATWYWDLLPANPAAVAVATDFGFEPIRHLTRMVRGEPIRGNDSMVFAIAGFEAG